MMSVTWSFQFEMNSFELMLTLSSVFSDHIETCSHCYLELRFLCNLILKLHLFIYLFIYSLFEIKA